MVLGASVCQAAEVELLQSTIVDDNALNFSSSAATFNRNVNGRTYQRFPMATFKGYQYATYYNGDRHVCLARRKLPDGAWEVIRFTDYTISVSDSHNVVSVGICQKDGTIHLMFDHHKDDLNYRVSNIGVASNPESVTWSTALFSSITDNLGSVGSITQLTYPTFFNAPNGNLMLYYRYGGSGSGDGMIQEYNGTTHDWTTGLGKFISRSGSYSGAYSSTSRNPYINGISYGGNRLHVSWGWRETSTTSASNHDLNYAYSDDDGRTWRNNAGTQIGTTGSSFISINSPGLIVAPIPQNIGLSNQYTHYAFPDGSCHVMVEHNNVYQHYWRNAAGTWSQGTLSFDGSRPKLCGDDDGNLFLAYADGGNPRIAKGVPNAGQTAWSWSQVYTESGTTEGGEGQIDYSRWESDRILSFYGQEEPPNTGEAPSPLHVFDYKVSGKAILPVPENGAAVLDVGLALEWTAGIDATAHRVYLGTSESAVASATTGSPEYKGEQPGTVFSPSPSLSSLGTYYWRIDEVQADSTVIPGMVWAFSLIPVGGTVTQVVDQGTWNAASTWDPAIAPMAGIDYETSMQLRSPSTSATFAGDMLTVLQGGELALRNIGAHVVVVPDLVLDGGNIRASTGLDVTSTLAGSINVLTNAALVGYWNTTGVRNLRILSNIGGSAELRSTSSNIASTHTLFIDNPGNSFSGAWISERGTIEFASAGAVGSADIDVRANGSVAIMGNWDGLAVGAALTVADSASATVDFGSNRWTVANLAIGSTSVGTGSVYTASELNALGAAVFAGSGSIQVGVLSPPPPGVLIAGWDGWDSDTAPGASYTASDITATATASAVGGTESWSTTDTSTDPGRGSSGDTTWGNHAGPPAASATTDVHGANFTLTNGKTDGEITLTINNTGTEDFELGAFHFDAVAFRPNAARTYALNVLAGSDISVGNVFTSPNDAITSLNGGLEGHDQHDDIEIYLNVLADNVLEAGGTVIFQLEFSSGTGDGGGHHLFVDNVGISLVGGSEPADPPVLEYNFSNGNMVFTWSDNRFKVQSRTNLVNGTWHDIPGGTVPPVSVAPTNGADFFRLIEQ
ncbi:hypothetical protein PDESU_01069 [Pontiella desulfatans]|uniref:Uncharacterized protein n=1 Tax=Pontiella desulfatans TaxID=2750659 RepID=A0A6C2TZA4_PONDE|nr:BNR repeat-containing protein [Pontiella desulfatans]VGO12516.1 hypothetical protein PDESU_01069 [Pontiella desulfatans]